MKNIMLQSVIIFLVSFFSVTGCSYAETADVVLKPTSEASEAEGKITVEETEKGVHVIAEISGLTPGDHGFHIHENGDCSDEGKAAGSHFNPDQTPHGYLAKDGFTHSHAGDLGNVQADADGKARFEGMIPNLTLKEDSKYSIGGRSFIVHEKADDFGQPVGNAGGRVACGIIEASGKSTAN